jgi:hypothetical protein
MVIIFLLLRQRVNLNYQHIFLKNNSSGLGRVPGMAATFHRSDQKHTIPSWTGSPARFSFLYYISIDETNQHIWHEGCSRLSQTSSGVRIKIIRNNRKNNFKRKAKRNFAFIRLTNVPEQNLNPQLDEQVINNDHSVRPFPIFRSADSLFSSNTLGFLKISWY